MTSATSLQVRQTNPPEWLIKKLSGWRGVYTEAQVLMIAINLEADVWVGVFGEPDSGTYEWFCATHEELETSDVGYGRDGIALKDVLNRETQ